LDLQHIGVTGTFNLEEMSVELYEGDGCSPANDQVFELDNVPHNAETKFVLTRPEGSEITDVSLDLSVKWRRKTPSSENEWNIITIPIPELTFFPFAPRILADVTPHGLHPDIPQCLVNYTFENPTSALLYLEIHIESSDVCAFAGPKQVRVRLMPFTSHVMRLIVLPVGREWVRLPRLVAMDDERKTVLEVLRLTNDLKVEGPELYMRVPS